MQIKRLHDLQKTNKHNSVEKLKELQQVSINNENTFASLMEAAKSCSLGQITHALYQVGGQYRRNM